MAWKIELTETARKQLAKLDKATAKRIMAFLNERLAALDNPRSQGKAMTGPLGDFWRYRVGDYRIIVQLEDECLVVLVVRIGHRGEVYH